MHGIVRIPDEYNKMKTHVFFMENGVLCYEQWIAGHLLDGPMRASETCYMNVYE